MNNTTIARDEAKRTRWLLILGVLLIVAAVAITAGRLIHSHMQQARLMQDRPADLQYGVKVYSSETGSKAQDMRSKYLAKASLLRDHWRVWALAHQDSLRQLRQAPPSDTATLMRFYEALPVSVELNQATGITLADIGMSMEDLNNDRAVRYTWNRAPPVNKDTDAANFQKMREDYTLYHDVAISQSMSAGRSRITLWADGRITEMTRLAHPARGRRPDGPEKEIAPPYDFLK